MLPKPMRRALRGLVKVMNSTYPTKAGMRLPDVHHHINERVVVQRMLDTATDAEQMVCRVVAGMDCDCVQYCRTTAYQRRSLVHEWKDLNGIYDDAEGPISVGFVQPSDAPEGFSRDLIAEAHEDGHPHCVHTY